MRGMGAVVMDLVHHGFARANVIGNVFSVGRAGNASRQIKTGDVETDAVTLAEHVRGRHHLDLIFLDGARSDRLAGLARQRMPRPPWLGAFRIERAMRSLEPAAGEFALGQVFWNFSFALANALHRPIGTDV